MKIGFLVTAAPYSFQDIDTVYHLARAALQKGHGVNIFLFMDAVIAVNKNIRSPGERSVTEMMQELVARGARIVACGDCAQFRGLRRDILIENTRMTGIATLGEMIEECDRFVTLGL
ncbi:DsrE family protein [candidate division WOR-3 bacterium]|nr:DsrE family protein [candidate division WOR-3 bacterium]